MTKEQLDTFLRVVCHDIEDIRTLLDRGALDEQSAVEAVRLVLSNHMGYLSASGN